MNNPLRSLCRVTIFSGESPGQTENQTRFFLFNNQLTLLSRKVPGMRVPARFFEPRGDAKGRPWLDSAVQRRPSLDLPVALRGCTARLKRQADRAPGRCGRDTGRARRE